MERNPANKRRLKISDFTESPIQFSASPSKRLILTNGNEDDLEQDSNFDIEKHIVYNQTNQLRTSTHDEIEEYPLTEEMSFGEARHNLPVQQSHPSSSTRPFSFDDYNMKSVLKESKLSVSTVLQQWMLNKEMNGIKQLLNEGSNRTASNTIWAFLQGQEITAAPHKIMLEVVSRKNLCVELRFIFNLLTMEYLKDKTFQCIDAFKEAITRKSFTICDREIVFQMQLLSATKSTQLLSTLYASGDLSNTVKDAIPDTILYLLSKFNKKDEQGTTSLCDEIQSFRRQIEGVLYERLVMQLHDGKHVSELTQIENHYSCFAKLFLQQVVSNYPYANSFACVLQHSRAIQNGTMEVIISHSGIKTSFQVHKFILERSGFIVSGAKLKWPLENFDHTTIKQIIDLLYCTFFATLTIPMTINLITALKEIEARPLLKLLMNREHWKFQNLIDWCRVKIIYGKSREDFAEIAKAVSVPAHKNILEQLIIVLPENFLKRLMHSPSLDVSERDKCELILKWICHKEDLYAVTNYEGTFSIDIWKIKAPVKLRLKYPRIFDAVKFMDLKSELSLLWVNNFISLDYMHSRAIMFGLQ